MKHLFIGDEEIFPGEKKLIRLRAAGLHDLTSLYIPVEVIMGKKSGPTLFISSAIHGDEINGVEIIRRILQTKYVDPNHLKGNLVLVPVVNVFGFNHQSRYLPDRRDLNRSFPGSETGSLAARMAHIFFEEVVRKCTHGIDLHTGPIHRYNLPQVRGALSEPEVQKMVKYTRCPVVITSEPGKGTIRLAAKQKGVPVILYEGGQALRYEEEVITTGVRVCLNLMEKLGMIELNMKDRKLADKVQTQTFHDSHWVRASHSGIAKVLKEPGETVKSGETVAKIIGPYGNTERLIQSRTDGLVVGKHLNPLVSRGDALIHIAHG